MRTVLALGATVLLAGCVPPEPMPTTYAPMQPYRLLPEYQPQPLREPPPLAQPLPPPPNTVPSFSDAPPAPNPAPPPAADDTGALPLNALPTPVPETPSAIAPLPDSSSGSTPPPATQTTPSTASGPGSNVPLEGFRPLHGVSRPTPTP